MSYWELLVVRCALSPHPTCSLLPVRLTLSPPSRLKRLADFIAYLVVRRPWLVIGLTVALLAGGAWVLTRHQALDSEVLNLLPPESEGVKALKIFNSEFRQGRELILALHGEQEQIADFEDIFLEKLRQEPW